MKRNTLDDTQDTQNQSVDDLKVWEKPTLNQLDIKQTLVVRPSGAPEGLPAPEGTHPIQQG